MTSLYRSIVPLAFVVLQIVGTLRAAILDPQIIVTHLPDYGSFQDMAGSVTGINDPSQYHLAVYIYTNGWWTKPTFAQPCTTIAADYSWVADVTTGGQDEFATRYAIFLLLMGTACPELGGSPSLPSLLYDSAASSVILDRNPQCASLNFAGYTWWVKTASPAVGPGPNFFSCENVWVDALNELHLRIKKDDENRWQCAEVVLDRSLGYGRYIFSLRGPIDVIDANMVIGMFTWDPISPAENYRELDIELSRWGNPLDPNNAQYVVQPYTDPANLERFPFAVYEPDFDLTVIMDWMPQTVTFRSYNGRYVGTPSPALLIHQWSRSGAAVPAPGSETIRLNFWLVNGIAPLNGLGDELVVTDFKHTRNLHPGRILGDFDESACTDLSDFLFLLDHWQQDFDGTPVDLSDFLNLLDHWQAGATCS